MTKASIQTSYFFAAAITATSAWTGAGSAQVSLSYATYFPANDPLVQVDRWFMEQVEERTSGAIKFEQYLGGAMLGGPEIYPGLSRGAVDLGMSVPAAFQANEYILSNVTLPYVTNDSTAVTYAFNQLLQETPALVQEYENQNIKLLYGLGFSENNIWSNTPIRTLEDMSGMRIRSVMSIADALNILGAVPVSMAFGDAVSAVQRGVIDGMSSAPFLTTVGFGAHEFVPFVSDGGGMGVYAVSSTGINLDVWSGLSSEHQAVIEEIVSEIPDFYTDLMNVLVGEAVDAVKEAGITEVIIMSDEEKARVRDAVVDPLRANWFERAQAADLDGEAFFERYNELVQESASSRNYVPGLELYVQRYGTE
ncbi:MAG: TRAP transporter substrate-binding protein DctP [Rhodobacterales bacterium]